MVTLTELQHDALVEIFNIGVGQAAKAMSEIVNDEVVMSVPSISFMSRANAAETLSNKEHRRVCGVSQHYEGAFTTDAILMFPEEKSLDIVRLMVGDAIPLSELTEMEQEAMSEIGNIILNSCVGMLANVFSEELHGSLPRFHVGTSAEILAASGDNADTVVLMLHIDFIIETHQIHGFVAFVLDLSALNDLQEQVNRYLSKIEGAI